MQATIEIEIATLKSKEDPTHHEHLKNCVEIKESSIKSIGLINTLLDCIAEERKAMDISEAQEQEIALEPEEYNYPPSEEEEVID